MGEIRRRLGQGPTTICGGAAALGVVGASQPTARLELSLSVARTYGEARTLLLAPFPARSGPPTVK